MKIDTTGKVAYWCKTEELAKEFLKECEEQGIKWKWEEKITDQNIFNFYHDETCYIVEDNGFAFGKKQVFIDCGYTVVEYKGKHKGSYVKNDDDHDDIKNRKEQIEEMAKEFSPYRAYCNSVKCEECVRKKMSKCRYYSFAKRFFLNGYRKQSETAKEILHKLIYNITENNTIDGYLSESIDYLSTIDDIKELAAQYGVKLEDEK